MNRAVVGRRRFFSLLRRILFGCVGGVGDVVVGDVGCVGRNPRTLDLTDLSPFLDFQTIREKEKVTGDAVEERDTRTGFKEQKERGMNMWRERKKERERVRE